MSEPSVELPAVDGDLATMNGVEALERIARKFTTRITNVHPHRSAASVDQVLPFLRHGVTDTATIEQWAASAPILDTLPAGYPLAASDVEEFVLVGGPAWTGDEDNRSEWAHVGRLAAEHDSTLDRMYRRGPDGGHRNELPAHVAVTAFYEAGRGPSYARQIIALAGRHGSELDAFGFGEEITPPVYDDLLTAGVRTRADLAGYLATGLTLGEAIAFRADGIAPAAVLFAQRAGLDQNQWLEHLRGIPAEWFRDLRGVRFNDPEVQDPKDYPYLLAPGGTDQYKLSELQFLASHGWTGKNRLSPRGIDGVDSDPAIIAITLAEHAMTFETLERWADALTVGKDPRGDRLLTSRPPLIGHGRGRRTFATVPVARLGDVVALQDAGLRPSHMSSYRKAGCTSVEQVLQAHAAGITATVADELCRIVGRKPSRHSSTWVIDQFSALMRAHQRATEGQQ
jgi:hypothetical protein